MGFLLDTCVVIDCLRQVESARVYYGRLESQPCISVVTMAEVMAGVRNRGEETDAAIFWSVVKPIRVDQEIALRAGAFVRLYHASHGVEVADALIAATAEHHGLKLATINVKHFPMFKRLKPAY